MDCSSVPLYGRNIETDMLRQSLEEARRGANELVFVTGEWGSGKTSLVSKFLKEQADYCIQASGKFEQLKSAEPYSALVSAFDSVCGELLLQSKSRHLWKNRLKQMGKMRELATILPNLTELMSENLEEENSPPFTEVDVDAAWSLDRLKRAFSSLTREICRHGGPFILFIDNIQWIDAGSFDVLKYLIMNSNLNSFMLIGCYRNDEVDPVHPLALMLRELEGQKRIVMRNIFIGNLYRPIVNLMVSEILKLGTVETYGLTDILFRQAAGNPLHTLQLLKYLELEDLITLDSTSGKWAYDTKMIEMELCSTGDLVELVASKLRQLSGETQEILTIASFLSSHFKVDFLAKLLSQDDSSVPLDDMKVRVVEKLDEAVEKGIIRQTSEKGSFLFTHEKVHEAVIELLPKGAERDKARIRVGNFLLDLMETTAKSEDWILVSAMDLLNQAPYLVSDKVRGAELNLAAAKTLIKKVAFSAASTFLSFGIEFLKGSDMWNTHYQLALELYTHLSESDFCQGHFEECYKNVSVVLGNAKSLSDKLRAHFIMVETLGNEARIEDAISHGAKVLRELGAPLPKQAKKAHVISAIIKTKIVVRQYDNNRILKLPQMTSSDNIATLRMLSMVMVHAYLHNYSEIFVVAALRMTRITLRQGLCKWSAQALTIYGVVSAILGNFEEGYRFGCLGNKVKDRFPSGLCDCSVLVYHHSFLNHLRNPLRSSTGPLLYAYQRSSEIGDLHSASAAAGAYCCTYFHSGMPLKQFCDEMAAFSVQLSQQGQTNHLVRRIYWQAGLCLRAEGTSNLIGDGDAFHADELDGHDSAEMLNNVYWYLQMIVSFCLNDDDTAKEMADRFWSRKEVVGGTVVAFPVHQMIRGLIATKQILAVDDKRCKKQLRRTIKFLKVWTKQDVLTVVPMLALLEACVVRLEKPEDEGLVLRAYDNAINACAVEAYVHISAIAHEQAGLYLIKKQGLVGNLAQSYLRNALVLFVEWGATAKVDIMLREYDFLSIDATEDPSTQDGFSTMVQAGTTGSPYFESFFSFSLNR